MSYILDALKKSERERSLGHVPTLNTVHSYPTSSINRRGLWLALALLIILALIGVTIYGVMFWGHGEALRSADRRADTSTSAVSRPVDPQKPIANPVADPRPTATKTKSVEAKGAEPVRRSTTLPVATARTPKRYPTINDLDGDVRQSLSDIVVNVVSYSEQPSRRFVMINQNIYRQGQSVNGRLTVVEIKPEGAILSFQGREFLAMP